jgi:hypothetical protein
MNNREGEIMSDQRETISYQGKVRQVRGRLHYPQAPQPGTIVGPNGMGETLVLFGTDERGTMAGLATVDDIQRAKVRVSVEGPSSAFERQRVQTRLV